MQNLLRSSFIPALLLLCISASFLFAIKHHVQMLNKELKLVIENIVTAKKDIHILKAELTYLSKADKIRNVIGDKLDLVSPSKTQILSIQKFNALVKDKAYEMRYNEAAKRAKTGSVE